MKELFDRLPGLGLKDQVDYLLDTCFIVWICEHGKEKKLQDFINKHKVAITSFNAEELDHIHHKLSKHTKTSLRKFLHDVKNLFLLSVPVLPGNVQEEHSFVRFVLPELDSKERDPSDAVLLAAAIKTGANVLTRDKHDIFNVIISNFLKTYNVKIFNKLETED